MSLRSLLESFVCLLGMSAVAVAQHNTARFFTTFGEPRTIEKLAFSPDGNRLALALKGGPLTIVNTASGETEREIKFDPFLIRFSANGRQILAVGFKETKFVNPTAGTTSDIKWKIPLGYVGVSLKQKSGKLLVDSITENGPAAASEKIHVGDELVAIVVDRQETSALGKSESVITKAMIGPIGTPIVLRLLPKGSGKTVEVELRRKPATQQGDRQVFREYGAGSSPQTCFFGSGANIIVQDANSGDVISILHPIEGVNTGRQAQSQDGHLLALASTRPNALRGESDLGLEVFDVDRQERTHFTTLDASRIDDIRFTPDGSQVLVGSYDRILVYDLKEKKIVEPILIGFDPKSVKVRKPDSSPESEILEATRSQLGLGGESRIQAPGRMLASFDVSADGTFVAVGGMNGNCTLWSVKEHRKLAEIGDPLKETDLATEVTLSADGRWVAYFAKGTLNIASVKDAISSYTAAPPDDSAKK